MVKLLQEKQRKRQRGKVVHGFLTHCGQKGAPSGEEYKKVGKEKETKGCKQPSKDSKTFQTPSKKSAQRGGYRQKTSVIGNPRRTKKSKKEWFLKGKGRGLKKKKENTLTANAGNRNRSKLSYLNCGRAML